MPRNLISAVREDGREAWVSTLPRALAEVAARWSLQVGEPFQPGGVCSWVAPVRAAGAGGGPLVLKLTWRHYEAEHEADALRFWDGDGAVKVVTAADVDHHTSALLLERCVPGTALSRRPEPEQDVVIAGLLKRLWRIPPDGHGFRSLQAMCDEWAGENDDTVISRRAGLDPGLVRQGLALFRSLPASAGRHVLLCTDLHAGNVLAAGREPWLAIDPKPFVGDPTYDALQHMLNCDARLRADPAGLARRMAGLLGLDPERLLLWLFARCVQESPHWRGLEDVARRIAPR